MTKSRKRQPIGEMTEDIVYWTGAPILNAAESGRIAAVVSNIAEITAYEIDVTLGTVTIYNVPMSESDKVRQVMDNRRVLNNQTLIEKK